jgi:hypothetical protein
VVAHDPILLGIYDDVGASGPRPCGRAGVLDEPDVQRPDSALEAVDSVLVVKRLRV